MRAPRPRTSRFRSRVAAWQRTTHRSPGILHPPVAKAMGGVWHPGTFRGYALESLSEAVSGSERRARSSFFEAPSRRIQMIFMVKGIGRNGM